MSSKDTDASFVLGFDGGGTKTECILADAQGKTLARAITGPSNPLRAGYMRAWFSLGEASDSVMARQKVTASEIGAVCAGLGGAGRSNVVRRVTSYFEKSFPKANVTVTTDLEIALDAAFDEGEGILLLAGTGSAAYGRDAKGHIARAGGRGPWFSDEGSAFDIGRQAVEAISLADEHRGPATALTKKIISERAWRDWTLLLEAIAKHPDDVFPKIFPFVAQAADRGDQVAQQILDRAAASLAGLALAVADDLGWKDRNFVIARSGGVYHRSKFFDAAIETEVAKALPGARLVSPTMTPVEAAIRLAAREVRGKGNAA